MLKQVHWGDFDAAVDENSLLVALLRNYLLQSRDGTMEGFVLDFSQELRTKKNVSEEAMLYLQKLRIERFSHNFNLKLHPN